ncbi:MAG: hypothetical protein MUF29_09050 [Chitinophagaceae bacterium]|jgi:hypothetical protein|nr:hypothetical protein [Chitinophagaceae bacterium]
MKQLSETWFADGYIDFELKKYTLLAYLQQVNRYFSEHKLYPQLSDLIFHYNNLLQFRNNKEYLQQQFPRRLTSVEMEKLTLLYEAMIADDEVMQELEDIIRFALQEMKGAIEGGSSLYEFVEDRLEITPVGLVPLDTNEGYFFLRDGAFRETRVYHYRLMLFEKHEARYRSIRTEYVSSWSRSLVHTVEHIKTELIRSRGFLPNPAVYNIETELTFPLEETLLPIAKRYLVKYISEAA